MATRKTAKRPAEAAAKLRLHRHGVNAAYLDKPAHLRTRAGRIGAEGE